MIKVWDRRGDVGLLDKDCVSVVGSRDASEKGLELAKGVTEVLVDRGFVVVSGMAKGVDTVVHRTALDLGGKTVAVLGLPFDRVYPPENRVLADEISEKGLLLTTASSDEVYGRHLFPRRNRYMARISLGTIVVEAGVRSGVRHQCVECMRIGRWIMFSKMQVDKGYEWVKGFMKSGADVFISIKELDKYINECI